MLTPERLAALRTVTVVGGDDLQELLDEILWLRAELHRCDREMVALGKRWADKNEKLRAENTELRKKLRG